MPDLPLELITPHGDLKLRRWWLVVRSGFAHYPSWGFETPAVGSARQAKGQLITPHGDLKHGMAPSYDLTTTISLPLMGI